MLLRLARACPNMDKIRRGVCRLYDCFSGTRIRQERELELFIPS